MRCALPSHWQFVRAEIVAVRRLVVFFISPVSVVANTYELNPLFCVLILSHLSLPLSGVYLGCFHLDFTSLYDTIHQNPFRNMVKKDIVICTLPLNDNYGGILQTAALQRAVRKLGYRCRTFKWVPPFRLKSMLGWCFYHFKNRHLPFASWARKLNANAHYFRSFIEENVQETRLTFPPYTSASRGVSQWIIGSDQVWRFHPNIPAAFYLLNFLPSQERKRSFAYAASFGSSEWLIDAETSQLVRRLAKDLRAVSVREQSGVDMCREHMEVLAEVMPDPTMLVCAREYDEMIEKSLSRYPKDYEGEFIAFYILDMTAEKRCYLETLSNKMKLPLVDMMYNLQLDAAGVLKRPIEQWLDIVKHASLVVTDSFHGTVFSIIYRTSFIVFNNEKRGSSRFFSLLSRTGLVERMVQVNDAPTIHPISKEKWNDVANEVESLQKKGISFLQNQLQDE